jgi:EAL domain-containing protein (putative c-di-GMP-specific phosphodiesterase class I)
MLHSPDDLTIIKGILNLAHAFSLDVIAEGVESHEQSTALIDLGCHLGQGYYFSRPMPADEFMTWFKKHHD